MIPAIGIMIGMYILTRMLELFNKEGQKTYVLIFCALTFIATIISMIDIMSAGSSFPRP